MTILTISSVDPNRSLRTLYSGGKRVNPADVKKKFYRRHRLILTLVRFPICLIKAIKSISNRGIVLSSNPIICPPTDVGGFRLAYEMERKAAIKVLLEQVIWEICNEYTWCRQRICRLPVFFASAPQSIFCS